MLIIVLFVVANLETKLYQQDREIALCSYDKIVLNSKNGGKTTYTHNMNESQKIYGE